MSEITPEKRRRGRPRKVVEQAQPEERRVNRDLPTRVPFGGMSLKLEVANKDPNYFYRWFSDRGDTIKRARRAGYEVVSEREAGRVLPEYLTNRDVHGGNQSLTDEMRLFGGRDEYGKDFAMVLMKQPMEYHLADQKAKQENVDGIERSIRRQASKDNNVANKYGDMTMVVKDQE